MLLKCWFFIYDQKLDFNFCSENGHKDIEGNELTDHQAKHAALRNELKMVSWSNRVNVSFFL